MQVLVKSRDGTDPKYGCPPDKRPIHEHINKSIVNVDKPAGPTSHQVTTWVRDIFKLSKAGHSGTLDPKVTGVLPVGLGESTKILQALLKSSKSYVCAMKLQGDASNNQVKKTLGYFQDMIYQRPPLKSAVKRQLRKRTIYRNTYLERVDDIVLYETECEAGTYIRKLCHDIGLILGVGAHMVRLRRTKAGPYTEDTLTTLHDLKDAYVAFEEGDETKLRKILQPMESAVSDLPKFWVKDSTVDAICHGATLKAPGVSKLTDNVKPGTLTAMFTLKDELLGLAESVMDAKQIMETEKGEVALPCRLTLATDTYPRSW